MGTGGFMDVSVKTNFSEPDFKFPSDGTMDPLGESSTNKFDSTNAAAFEDVFGKSVLDFDVWLSPNRTSPKQKVSSRKTPKHSSSSGSGRSSRPRSRSQPKLREGHNLSTREERKLEKEKKKKSKRGKSVDTLKAVPRIEIVSSKSPRTSRSPGRRRRDPPAAEAPTIPLTDASIPLNDVSSELLKTPSSKTHRRKSATISADDLKTPSKPPRTPRSSSRRKSMDDKPSSSKSRSKSPKPFSSHRRTSLETAELSSERQRRSSRTPSRRRRSSHGIGADDSCNSIGLMDITTNIELAPTLDPLSCKKISTKKPKRRQSSDSIDSFTTDDRIGELMGFLRKENGAEKSDLMSSPATSRKVAIPSDPKRLRKKLLEEDSGAKKSYLPKSVKGRVYGSDFRKERRRDSVKDSLHHFLKDTADDAPARTAERTVVSAPAQPTSTKKVRSSRSSKTKNKPRVKTSQTLESHLHSTRVLSNNQDNEYRSVVSAPAPLGKKCQQYQVTF